MGFQNAVQRVDEISDQLREEVGRVNDKKRLLVERERLESRLPQFTKQIESCRKNWAAIQNEWHDLWSPLGIEPSTPSEMLEWRENYKELKSQLEELDVKRCEIDQLKKLVEEHRSQLTICLVEVSSDAASLSKKNLLELMEQAQHVLDEISERQNSQAHLEEEIAKFQQSMPNFKQAAESAAAELSDWKESWGTLMTKIGLPEDATPGQANAILKLHTKLMERLQERDSLAVRVRAMQDVNRQFERRVQNLVQHLSYHVQDLSPTQIVSKLHNDLNSVLEAQNKLKRLQQDQDRQRRDLQQCEQQIEQSEAELREMCKQANCDDSEDLPQAEKNSARRLQLEQDQSETREDILRFAGEASFEEFLKEADAEDTDALGGQLADLARQIEEVEQKLTRQIERTVNEQNLLDSKSGGSQAAEAAEEKQALLAEIALHLERYIQLKLAFDVLREGAERYRKKHQGPVLGRASELFRKLTCDSFLRLQNDGDDQGKPRLVGVRRHREIEESIELKGMSDGTADQLYLALRIASLEDWLDHHPPMPFVVDDVLINFDDQRAIAALRVLADLSRRTQVIFFTHHQHLVELAEAHLPGDVLVRHDLGQTQRGQKTKAPSAKKDEAATLF